MIMFFIILLLNNRMISNNSNVWNWRACCCYFRKFLSNVIIFLQFKQNFLGIYKSIVIQSLMFLHFYISYQMWTRKCYPYQILNRKAIISSYFLQPYKEEMIFVRRLIVLIKLCTFAIGEDCIEDVSRTVLNISKIGDIDSGGMYL